MNPPTFAELLDAVNARQYPDESDQNVEILQQRLMAFANAGGPAALATLWVWAKNLADNMPSTWKGQEITVFAEYRDKAGKALAILNGTLDD